MGSPAARGKRREARAFRKSRGEELYSTGESGLPLYVAALAVVFLDEPLRWTSLIGGALVIGGGLLAAREAPARGEIGD